MKLKRFLAVLISVAVMLSLMVLGSVFVNASACGNPCDRWHEGACAECGAPCPHPLRNVNEWGHNCANDCGGLNWVNHRDVWLNFVCPCGFTHPCSTGHVPVSRNNDGHSCDNHCGLMDWENHNGPRCPNNNNQPISCTICTGYDGIPDCGECCPAHGNSCSDLACTVCFCGECGEDDCRHCNPPVASGGDADDGDDADDADDADAGADADADDADDADADVGALTPLAGGGDATPATGGDTTPATGGDATPATGGDATPATGGDATPATGGDATPATGGDTTPATGGDIAPPAAGGGDVQFTTNNGFTFTLIADSIGDNAAALDFNAIEVTITGSATTIAGARVPANSIVINPNFSGEFGFDLVFRFTAEQLAEAGLNGNNARLYHISGDGVVTDMGRVTRYTDGSISVTISSASQFVLAESAPEDANPATGVVLGVTAVVIAGAFAVVARKRVR